MDWAHEPCLDQQLKQTLGGLTVHRLHQRPCVEPVWEGEHRSTGHRLDGG